jgi:hypothetical protein
MELLYYLDLIIAIVMLTLFGIGAYSLYVVHKRLCAVFEKQIEIEKMQVELKYELKHRDKHSIFG